MKVNTNENENKNKNNKIDNLDCTEHCHDLSPYSKDSKVEVAKMSSSSPHNNSFNKQQQDCYKSNKHHSTHGINTTSTISNYNE